MKFPTKIRNQNNAIFCPIVLPFYLDQWGNLSVLHIFFFFSFCHASIRGKSFLQKLKEERERESERRKERKKGGKKEGWKKERRMEGRKGKGKKE